MHKPTIPSANALPVWWKICQPTLTDNIWNDSDDATRANKNVQSRLVSAAGKAGSARGFAIGSDEEFKAYVS